MREEYYQAKRSNFQKIRITPNFHLEKLKSAFNENFTPKIDSQIAKFRKF